MPNEILFSPASDFDMYREWVGHGEFEGFFSAGRDDGDERRGAIRFPGVTIAQGTTISRAGLIVRASFVGGGGNTIRITADGIKETNTGSFTGSPFGRPRTTASVNASHSASGSEWDVDITSVVQEIINQGGWSSGNALGIVFEDNSSDSEAYFTDAFAGGFPNSVLSIRLTSPDLTPTPKTVSAPTFPAAQDYGLKISIPGVDVKTATEDQLLFTTRKDYLKTISEAQVTTVAGVEKLISHGLGYAPQCLVFVRKNGYSFELPRLFDGTDPVGGGVKGWWASDATYLRLITLIDAECYYYILREEQAS